MAAFAWLAPPDPWLTLQAAVLRTSDERPPWHPEQQLPARVALDASTADGAALRPGMPADLVVVERDPLAIEPKELGAMPVYGTMVAGRWTS